MQEMSAEQMKAEVRSLWELCFHDTPEFMDLYFRLRYRDELNESIVHEGRVVSALQIIPYELSSWGKRLPMAYLSGVCTHPEARRQGWMRRLLVQTHRRLYKDGYPVSTLIPAEPWLFDCYAASGYVTAFKYAWEHCPVVPPEGIYSVTDYREDPQGVYAYFCRKMEERPCCVLHSESDFQVLLTDLYLGGGSLWVARQDGRVVGMAFCMAAEADVCRINECLTDTPDVRRALVEAACRHSFAEYAEWLRPAAEDEESHPLGMLRVIHAEKVLTLYAETHPEFCACWRITDPDIPENNATYRLEQGRCWLDSSADAIPLHIKELPSRLWAGENPYMSLMMN